MAANTDPIFVGSPLTTTANTEIANTFENADGTTTKDIVAGATDGTLIQDLNAVSTDTADHDATIYFYDGSTSHQIGLVQIPASSGNDNATASVSLLNVSNIPSLNKRDDGAIMLATGQKLQCAMDAAVTSGLKITILALGGNL